MSLLVFLLSLYGMGGIFYSGINYARSENPIHIFIGFLCASSAVLQLTLSYFNLLP